MTQVIITLPVKAKYEADNLAAMGLRQKIGFSIIVANLYHGYLILSKTIANVPVQFGIFHLCVAAIVLYAIVKSYTTPNARWN